MDFDAAGFSWIDCNDNENSVVSFIRRGQDGRSPIVAILNFTPVQRDGYRIGVPRAGAYTELLNSDAEVYGGGNVGNGGAVVTEPIAAHGHPQSLRLTLPALSLPAAEAGGRGMSQASGFRPRASGGSAGTAARRGRQSQSSLRGAGSW